MLLGRLGGMFGDCKEREARKVCHQSFWCGQDRAHAINLSTGGMCLRIARRAEPGEEVVLSHGPLYSVKGRIAWTRRLKNCTEVGIQFVDTQAKMKSWLGFLRSEGLEEASPKKPKEKLLALPAPEHTQRARAPYSVPLNTAGSVGRTWKTAARLMNSNSQY